MKVLLLRTCNSDLTSHGGFRWPESGLVEAPDWNNRAECGGGLHGLLWGEGDGCLLDWDKNAKWLVFEAFSEDIINIDDRKSKAKRGEVVYCGDRRGASDYILSHNRTGRVLAVAGAAVTVGDNQTATAGYNGTSVAGFKGIAAVGKYGTAMAGNYGIAIAGMYGRAIAGYEGTARVGNGGTATAGYKGVATAGDHGTIQIEWWDGMRYRLAVGYVGEEGIKANKAYVIKNGKFFSSQE